MPAFSVAFLKRLRALSMDSPSFTRMPDMSSPPFDAVCPGRRGGGLTTWDACSNPARCRERPALSGHLGNPGEARYRGLWAPEASRKPKQRTFALLCEFR